MNKTEMIIKNVENIALLKNRVSSLEKKIETLEKITCLTEDEINEAIKVGIKEFKKWRK